MGTTSATGPGSATGASGASGANGASGASGANGASGATGAGTTLRFDHVGMVYPDGTHALDDVSFGLGPGELVSVVGPSGCGKSTLLRIASGLATASRGDVEVDTEEVGYVFQDATLLPWRTVQANVELFAELRGVPKDERRRLAAEAIELVWLKGFERQLPRRLSGGMRMRVSLARSLTLKPGVFLFDEPFGALDEITRERLNDELLRLFVSQRFAGLFITHSVSEAVFLSTRVLVMSPRPGRIVADVEVPFPYPRAPELRFEPRFAALAGEVLAALRDSRESR
jgi:NitT/TauT family transport system ATP-binding protein